MAKRRHIIGVDLGGTNMQVGVVDADGQVVSRAKRKTKADEGHEAILDRIAEAAGEAAASAGVDLSSVAALGIGAPGCIDPDKGVVIEAVNLRWNDLPLAKLLSARVGVPVVVDNDVNAAVWGEHQHGAGRGADDLMGVWVGTGIGGGLVLRGRLYHGHFLSAGEIGHVIAYPHAMPGSRSLEHNCSRTSVVDRLARLIRSNRPSLLTKLSGGDVSAIKSRMVAEAYKAGDELTVEVVDETAGLLGTVLAGVVTLLSLERLVLGGGLTEALGKPYVKRVQDTVRKFVFPAECRAVEVVASELEDDAGVVGAALLAQERAA